MRKHGWQIMALAELVLLAVCLFLIAGKLEISFNQPQQTINLSVPSPTLIATDEESGEQFLTFHFTGEGVTAGYVSHAIIGNMEWRDTFFAIKGTGEISIAIQVSDKAATDVAGNVSASKFSQLFCAAQTQLGNPTTIFIGDINPSWIPSSCNNAA